MMVGHRFWLVVVRRETSGDRDEDSDRERWSRVYMMLGNNDGRS